MDGEFVGDTFSYGLRSAYNALHGEGVRIKSNGDKSEGRFEKNEFIFGVQVQ